MNIRMQINIYIHAYVHTHIHTHIHACIRTSVYIYRHIYIYVCIYTYLHIFGCTFSERHTYPKAEKSIFEGSPGKPVEFLGRLPFKLKSRILKKGCKWDDIGSTIGVINGDTRGLDLAHVGRDMGPGMNMKFTYWG